MKLARPITGIAATWWVQAAANRQMKLAYLGVDFVKTEHLYTFDGEPGFSLG